MKEPAKNSERGARAMQEAVRSRRTRRERWQREGERSLGENLAMIGVLGWMIVTPALLGIVLGRWLDRQLDSEIFWTLGLLFAGLVLGCAVAWNWMRRG